MTAPDRLLALVASVLVAPALARADAIGPLPTAEDCPRGSASAVANEMRHGQFAYCAPSVATPDAVCREGYAHVVLGLMIRERAVWSSGGHGAPVPAEPAARLAEVTGPCDPPADETPITAPTESGVAMAMMGGPSIEAVPAGCHRIDVWVEDARVRCDPAPLEPSRVVPAGEAPAPAPTSVAEVPRATSATPPAPSSGCACSASSAQSARGLLVAALAWLAAARRPLRRHG